jgi:hypothetical protein
VARSLLARVDIVCYCEHEVAGDEEAGASPQLSLAVPEVNHSHAVVREGPHRLFAENKEILVPKVNFVLIGLPFHLFLS